MPGPSPVLEAGRNEYKVPMVPEKQVTQEGTPPIA